MGGKMAKRKKVRSFEDVNLDKSFEKTDKSAKDLIERYEENNITTMEQMKRLEPGSLLVMPQRVDVDFITLYNRSSVGTSKVDLDGKQTSSGIIETFKVPYEYFDLCGQILDEYPFATGRDRFIFDLHSKGLTEEEIAVQLTLSVYPKRVQAAGVGKIIRKIIAEFKVNIYPKPKKISFTKEQLKRNVDLFDIYQTLNLTGLGDFVGPDAKAFIELSQASGDDPKFTVLQAIAYLDKFED